MSPSESNRSILTPSVPVDQENQEHLERIEILSVELLNQNRLIVTELKNLAKILHLEFGWHYLLDLSWTIRNVGSAEGLKILDAGAGMGILQWYLAQAGAEVTSVDRMSRASLPLRYRNRFSVHGLRKSDLLPAWRVMLNYIAQPLEKPGFRPIAGRIMAVWRDLFSCFFPNRSSGSVLFYHQDLSHLIDIPDQTFDAVVSISALEHNPPQDLPAVIHELMRVLKPGGVLAATLVAARDKDWFHQASSGWCLTEASLREFFDLAPAVPSNFTEYDNLFAALSENDELRDNLARFYSHSDSKGMPGGIWNPEYQPVGVLKIKKSDEA